MTIDKWKLFKSLEYEPHSGQLAFHKDESRFRVAVCGRRFGKSVMAARDRQASLFNPGTIGWIVGPSYFLGEKEFRVMWNDLMVSKGLLADKRFKRSYNLRGGEMYIQTPWGSRVDVRSEGQPENLVGDGLNWVILSEAAKLKRETYERYLRPALTDFHGEMDAVTTAEGFNWIYELYLRGQNPDFENWRSWRLPSWLNHYVYPEGEDDPEIKELRQTTSNEWFLQEIAADFAAIAGRIFDEFSEETHCVRHTFRPDWPNYMCMDWGFSAPLAAMEFQVSPQDDIYVWREHYKAHKTLASHLEELKERENPEGYRLDLCFGDAADPEAIQMVNEQFGPCIGDPASKQNWREGIELYKSFMRPYHDGNYDDFERPIMKPKYFIDFSCTNHIRELHSYRTKDKQVVEEANKAGAARKEDDHTIDAIRYGLMHLFKLGARGGSLAEVLQPQTIARDHKYVSAVQDILSTDSGLVHMGDRF